MSNPNVITLAANVWTKIASEVTVGQCHIMSSVPDRYYVTHRIKNGTPPLNSSLEDAVSLAEHETITSSEQIDVYVYAFGGIGKIRIDI